MEQLIWEIFGVVLLQFRKKDLLTSQKTIMRIVGIL